MSVGDNPLVTAAQALLAAGCLLVIAAGNLVLAPVWVVARVIEIVRRP